MTVSSGLSLAFMVIGLLAVIFAFGVVWRRTASTPRDAGQLTQASRDQVTQEADHIRARAEAEATGILERARQEAEQAAQGRREVEEEIRAVKDEVRELARVPRGTRGPAPHDPERKYHCEQPDHHERERQSAAHGHPFPFIALGAPSCCVCDVGTRAY